MLRMVELYHVPIGSTTSTLSYYLRLFFQSYSSLFELRGAIYSDDFITNLSYFDGISTKVSEKY